MKHVEISRPFPGVVVITIDRPHKRNALSAQTWEELGSAFRAVGSSGGDQVVVLTGTGAAFCAGADLTDMSDVDEAWEAQLDRLSRTVTALHELPKPTIAAVNGAAVGAGAGLALGCDVVIATTTARFAFNFLEHGLTPDAGTSWLLPRLVGRARTLELLYRRSFIDAAAAQRLGLVSQVVEAGSLDSTWRQLANELVGLDQHAVYRTKEIVNRSLSLSMTEVLALEADAQKRALGSPAVAAALKRFQARNSR